MKKYVADDRQFGYVILTTNKGIMDHVEARVNHMGVRFSNSSAERYQRALSRFPS